MLAIVAVPEPAHTTELAHMAVAAHVVAPVAGPALAAVAALAAAMSQLQNLVARMLFVLPPFVPVGALSQ